MNNYKVSAGTIARTIVLVLSLVNMVLNAFGIQAIPVEDEAINTVVSDVWVIVAALAAWWKNNSFTQAALAGDAAMKAIKADNKASEG